jgi:hypothetical protein
MHRVISMSRVVLAAAALLAPRELVAQREVGHLVHSDSLPRLDVEVSGSLVYLGRLTFAVDTVAQAEEFVFGDTAQGRLQRAVIVHFEHFLPSTTHTFNYPRLQMARLGADEYLHQTWALADFELFRLPAMVDFLQARDLRAEPRWLVDRYVRAVTDHPQYEVIIFYLEAGSASAPGIVYGGAPVAPPPPPTPPDPVLQPLLARSRAAFRVLGP